MPVFVKQNEVFCEIKKKEREKRKEGRKEENKTLTDASLRIRFIFLILMVLLDGVLFVVSYSAKIGVGVSDMPDKCSV